MKFLLQDVQANEARVADIKSLAKRLLGERHPDAELIASRQEALNQAWDDLRTLAQHRQERLAGAHEIQKFNRWVRLLRNTSTWYTF